MISFIATLVGLGFAARLMPWLPSFVNWFFVFPVAMITFGTMAYTLAWVAMGFEPNFHGWSLSVLIIGLPLGFIVAKVANAD